ncbi:MAG: M50 family metallopeptidase [Propioniciclava sp.]|uniref:M50 family metallopeptidase n=1 Tax=Propioniciclava sp. TaxID=2038686 RepID=UPI0039E3B040
MELLWTAVFGVLFFALLMVSVALHELGHLLPAKLFGVRVPQYFVGFGKTLWSVRRGDTVYGIKAFPLGGFVQLLGMYPPPNPRAKPTWLRRVADDARRLEWGGIEASDDGALFYQKKTYQKLIIMAGGITMNLLIAFGLFWAVTGLYGTPTTTPLVHSIQQCVTAEQRDCTAADPLTPAAQAGLQSGDRIVAFNGTPIADYPQLTELIRANLDAEATLVVERAGQQVTLPTVHTRLSTVADPADASKTTQVGSLGVYPSSELIRGGPGEVLVSMADLTRQSVVAIVQFPVKVWNVVADMIAGQPRSLDSPVSIVGASVVAGQASAQEDFPVAARAAMFASLLASVNLFLALFNLVPLPPLDGGHIAGALWEWLRRTFARLGGRPDPGHVDTAKMVPVSYLVGGFILLCGVVLIVADIVSPVKIF